MKEKIIEILKNIATPYQRENLIQSALVTSILEKNGTFYLLINGDLNDKISGNDLSVIKHKIEAAILIKLGIKLICIIETKTKQIDQKITSDFSKSFTEVNGVKNTICVVSGKGGVGKTTSSVIIAKNLQKMGYRIGICDLDIYGPSIPLFFQINEKHCFQDGKITPIFHQDFQIASIGLMIDDSQPIIWRGPMISKAINQLTRDVGWRDLDFLIIDTPPGTGDVHLTILQQIPVNYCIAVTTGDEMSITNTAKTIEMFSKLSHPVDLIINNMSHITTNQEKIPLFNSGDIGKITKKYDIQNIAEIPFLNKQDIESFSTEDHLLFLQNEK
jgi:ATP-binding protein involved in chromosome partitioning